MVNLIKRFTPKALLLTSAIASLMGCSSYPEKATGGLAENYIQSNFTPVMPDEPLGPEHGLRFDWQIAKLHLDALIREGARWCFPAAVVQAIEKQNRIARELEGGLLLDAANDIVIQRKRLEELEQQLDYVTAEARCAPPTNEKQFQENLSLIDQLYNLLNVDNQFAFNSTEVNPKYMRNLAKASGMLLDNSDLHLVITGHSDAIGGPEYNLDLALGRAQQVERYLTIFGLPKQRVETQSLGEQLPLFDGDSEGVRLTNRRVSIEIIERSSQSKSNNGL